MYVRCNYFVERNCFLSPFHSSSNVINNVEYKSCAEKMFDIFFIISTSEFHAEINLGSV